MPSASAPRRSQQDRSSSTRKLLISAGRQLFAERGYAEVSADEISAAAGLTRGALYHHYGGKEELFAAVFEDLEREVAAEIGAVLAGPQAAVSAAGPPAAIARFLDLCVRPDVIRIALTDAPAVLGWERWRKIESAHGLGLVADALQTAVDAGLVIAVPVRTLAQLVLSAVIEAALLIAHSPEPRQARAEADQALAALLNGLVQ